MKAIQIESYGHSDQLHSAEVPLPKIEANQVLVQIHDSGINPMDWKIREGYMKEMRPVHFPLIMGQDFAGQVTEVGSEIREFKAGDRVFGFASGAYVEYAAINEDRIALMPLSADFVTAASLPTPGLTALQILMNVVKPKAKDRILIHGAGGAVGSLVVQIARHLGAEVIANASDQDAGYLRHLGVEKVIDHRSQRFEEFAKDMDAVIDLVGGETAQRSYQIIKKGGILVSTVGAADMKEAKKYEIHAQSFVMHPNAADLEQLANLYEAGVIMPRVDRILPFEEFRMGQDMVESGQAHGKIVLEVSQGSLYDGNNPI